MTLISRSFLLLLVRDLEYEISSVFDDDTPRAMLGRDLGRDLYRDFRSGISLKYDNDTLLSRFPSTVEHRFEQWNIFGV